MSDDPIEVWSEDDRVTVHFSPENNAEITREDAFALYERLGKVLGIERFPPACVITADDLSPEQLNEFREQIDLALADPEYCVITNFEIQVIELADDVKVVDP